MKSLRKINFQITLVAAFRQHWHIILGILTSTYSPRSAMNRRRRFLYIRVLCENRSFVEHVNSLLCHSLVFGEDRIRLRQVTHLSCSPVSAKYISNSSLLENIRIRFYGPTILNCNILSENSMFFYFFCFA